MDRTSFSLPLARRLASHSIAASLCALALAPLDAAQAGADSVPAPSQIGTPSAPGVPGAVSATVEECLTASTQAERAATFSGEMSSIAGAAHMSMRIEVQERMPGESAYRTVEAPGLGVWRGADPKVKVYKYLKQVTNLSAPASYRALVRFRWLSSKGHVIKRAERLTPSCLQPAPANPPIDPTPEMPPGGSTPSASTGPSASA
jgi:hypothetical protein